jgi:hypothetical protein
MRTIGRWTLSGILAIVAAGALSFGAAAQSRQDLGPHATKVLGMVREVK